MAIIRRPRRKNQSPDHEDLGHRSLVWLAQMSTNKGFRGDVEVPLNPREVGPAYVADAVAQLNFQSRFRDRYGIPKGPLDLFSCIFEVKVSRSDFRKTFCTEGSSRLLAPAGNFHWVVTTPDLVKAEEVPSFWGLLEESHGGLHEVKKPSFQSIQHHEKIAYSILWYGTRRAQRYKDIKICQHCTKRF